MLSKWVQNHYFKESKFWKKYVSNTWHKGDMIGGDRRCSLTSIFRFRPIRRSSFWRTWRNCSAFMTPGIGVILTQTSHIKNVPQTLKTLTLCQWKYSLYAHFRSFCDNSTGSSFKKPCSCPWISPSSSIGFSWSRSTNSSKRRRMASTKHTSGNSSTDR